MNRCTVVATSKATGQPIFILDSGYFKKESPGIFASLKNAKKNAVEAAFP
jgi:hypothetical protein